MLDLSGTRQTVAEQNVAPQMGMGTVEGAHWHANGIGQGPQNFSTQIPPQHAGEMESLMHSGVQMQPLPCHLPAMISLGTSVPSPFTPP